MDQKNLVSKFRRLPFEAFIWIAGFIVLGLDYPASDNHFTICPLALSGFEWCPGCGLGRSISYLLHGDVQLSFTAHPLGIPAVIILTFRIIQLLKKHIQSYGTNN